MAAIAWPTHKAKARARKNLRLYKAKRSKIVRRLYRDGKRGDLCG